MHNIKNLQTPPLDLCWSTEHKCVEHAHPPRKEKKEEPDPLGGAERTVCLCVCVSDRALIKP